MKKNTGNLLLLTFVFIFAGMSTTQADDLKLSYELSFPEPHTHYVEVNMNISGIARDYVDVKMPVWAPGSYLIREFAKNVQSLTAQNADGKVLSVDKISKNTWRIVAKGHSAVEISYRVYAFELSVRTSFINTDHAYLNGTSVFMFIDGVKQLPSTITVHPHEEWKKISTGLEPVADNPYVLKSPNYDVLADSPMEIGNQDVFEFDVDGVLYQVAMYGGGDYNKEDISRDFTKIIREQTSVFGENPNERYLFIVHLLPNGGGGLEHLNSTTLQYSVERIATEKGYIGFMELASHEHFHLWNVKRLRPFALGPFDYDEENYTHMLWVAEGFTSYYDKWIVRRVGLTTADEYLGDVINGINYVENLPGNKVQSAAEASFDAWIKQYRPNENSSNTTVSYYSKGAIIAVLADMEIREHSKGKQTLDDFMQYMYEKYAVELDRGYKDEEFKAGLEKFAGNMDTFFAKYVYGNETPDYDEFFDAVGLKVVNTNTAKDEAEFGARVSDQGEYWVVTRVTRGTGAYASGINVGDAIISIDGQKRPDLEDYLKDKKPGDKIAVRLIREGKMRTINVTLSANDNVAFSFEKLDNPTKRQEQNYKNWLEL